MVTYRDAHLRFDLAASCWCVEAGPTDLLGRRFPSLLAAQLYLDERDGLTAPVGAIFTRRYETA